MCLPEPLCHVLGCTGTRADCNVEPGDGCEVDLCTDASNCDACGVSCGTARCVGGVCEGVDQPPRIYVLTNAVTGAAIPGATITFEGSCRAVTRTTNMAGQYTLNTPFAGHARVIAAGYPVHIQPVDRVTGVGSLIPQSRIDAWLADPDLIAAPDTAARAMVIAGYTPPSRSAPHTMRADRDQAAMGADLLPSSGAGDRQVFFDVLPGRALIGGTMTVGGCFVDCGPSFELLLRAGTVTHVRTFDCVTACP
jgi:hypothetical protein